MKTYVPGNGANKTTGLVGTYKNGSDAAYSYTYDDNGNITEITQGSTSITYEYDAANRLTRENNGLTNETVTYEYDVWGNILNRKVYAYTTADDLTGLTYTLVPYAYTNTAWGDQLTEYNGQTITYDSMGNPTSYRGYTFGWRGKQLVSAGNGTNSLTFEYNEDGLRQKKTVNNVDTDYFYNGSVLIGMQRGTDKLLFSYDAGGSAVSVSFNGTEYYYLRNAQGDIVKLIDASGATVVEYTYDTWGKEVQITGSLASSLGLIQPFRYRGYVYDEETALYYLQSRYYDPEVGRFISADILLSTGQGVLGHNCYAYCLGNPVNMVDYCGCASTELPEVPPLVEIKRCMAEYYKNDSSIKQKIKQINYSSAFSIENWNSTDYEGRVFMLYEYVDRVSEIMGLKKKPQLEIVAGTRYTGEYKPQSNTIELSDFYLTYALNGDNYKKALVTLVHECRHAFQNQYAAENPSSFLTRYMQYEMQIYNVSGKRWSLERLNSRFAERDAYAFCTDL